MNELQVAALRALKLMDLTSLNDDDTDKKIIELCKQAKTPYGNTAAVCVYPRFVAVAKKQLREQGTPEIRVATVTNFPHGYEDIDIAVAETKAAIAYGADDVDVVFPYRALLDGRADIGYQLVKQCKAACGEKTLLKVIIESGELDNIALIREATEISINAGADMVKTSTGKVPVNATLEASDTILQVIKELGVEDTVGFKASGGVQIAEIAKMYLDIVDRKLGEQWSDSRHYRFGASSLLDNLISCLEEKVAPVPGSY